MSEPKLFTPERWALWSGLTGAFAGIVAGAVTAQLLDRSAGIGRVGWPAPSSTGHAMFMGAAVTFVVWLLGWGLWLVRQPQPDHKLPAVRLHPGDHVRRADPQEKSGRVIELIPTHVGWRVVVAWDDGTADALKPGELRKVANDPA